MKKEACRFIFVTGGVVSSIGKGLTVACIASLLQSAGLRVAARKFDPYLNVDPGTMSPVQHGEVFVTGDGAETDLDLGHYERFTDIEASASDSITAGKIYSDLLDKERRGFYLGQTVQVIPHVTDLIKEFIYAKSKDLDVIICEIGGTVGDIEGQPFFEAVRQVAYESGKQNVAYIHVTLVPYIKVSDEIKTKPTQHSVKALNALGIQPDIIICRTQKDISLAERKKIALFCSVEEGNVVDVKDVKNIYDLPILYKEQCLEKKILRVLGIEDKSANTKRWQNISKVISTIKDHSRSISIAIVGKYSESYDAYKSVFESIQHACFAQGVNPVVKVVDAKNATEADFDSVSGIVIPGGFGKNGIGGKVAAIKYARINKIPLFAICLGFQLVVIEFAKNILKLEDPNSTEFDLNCKNNVVALLEEWQKDSGQRQQHSKIMGGTMRLGAYDCVLKQDSIVYEAYGLSVISERHRHRYEVNSSYKSLFEDNGLEFSGCCKLNPQLLEIAELKGHPWFVGVQFHPEFRSRIFNPHPLFVSFIRAAKCQQR